ncbi:RNA ligase [Longispora fulva]|uniref:RNA ligase (TIGR02306 family) n=1 Tax=Longispora fulva TaxID=619741 RepID=A0A8J7H4W3_9ACTN|nr:RNA ligase (ATP) [Longispora fulva]MBG6141628.1 RNA ligase (TIGR02306 family) [Longispora fulva]GIG59218.1 RNA ligase [Longispora fulva]
MSTLTVTAERLVIHEHPNADALELAQVGLYRAVVAKGAYRTGEFAVYIPEQSVLPAALIEELGLTGRLAGGLHDRVAAVRLRGEISQGIVCRPAALAGVDLEAAHHAGEDFTARLGITKWVPAVPVHMAGEVEPAADLLPWVDIENIKRYPAIFEPGEPVVATEKLHGTCCLLTWSPEAVLVSSKGLGEKRLGLVRAGDNLYWRTVEAHGVPAAAEWLAGKYGAGRVGIFGEVYGAGIQDLAYGANGQSDRPGYAAFDVSVEVDGHVRWLTPDEFAEAATLAGLPTVPTVYTGPYDEGVLFGLASGPETVTGTAANIREGLVVRSATGRGSAVLGGRAIAKFVSDAYVTRKGGTEYE